MFLQKMKISGVRKKSKPSLPEQWVLMWQQRQLWTVQTCPQLTVNQPSAVRLKSHFPASSGTPLQACPQPFTAEASRSSTVCKCDHRRFSWQAAAGQVCCSKSKSNPGDQSPPKLELPGNCQQLNRNAPKTPKGCNSGAVPSETQGCNENQLLNSCLPGSQRVAQTVTVREGSCQVLTARALSNHKAAVSAKSQWLTQPPEQLPQTHLHNFTSIQRLLNTSLL